MIRNSDKKNSIISKFSKNSNSEAPQMFNSYKTEQIEQLREIFKMYDRDNTGNISNRTLKFLLRGLGDNVNEEQVDIILKDMDEDGNGTIDFQEFLLYMLEKVNAQSLEDDLIEVFKVFDKNGTGCITKNQIDIIISDPQYNSLIQEFSQRADMEDEGEIDYRKYLKKILKE